MRDSASTNTLAAWFSGASNNTAPPGNGLAVLFMATGQDMARIGEANQCGVHTDITRAGAGAPFEWNPDRGIFI